MGDSAFNVNYVGWVSLLINHFGPFCSYNFLSLPQLNAKDCITEPPISRGLFFPITTLFT